jgi:hypothetical protein
MTEQDRLAKELFDEMKAEYDALMAAKRKPKPPAEVVKLVVNNPDTPIEDAIEATHKAETFIEQQIRLRKQRQDEEKRRRDEEDEEQIRLSNDPARNNHYNSSLRRAREAAPQARPDP